MKITGGDKLNAVLAEKAKKAVSKTLDVGFYGTANDGQHFGAIAFFNEFGTPNARFPIPPRPFFRTMIRNGKPHWGNDIATQLIATDGNVDVALDRIGQQLVGELQQSIVDMNSPGLSQTTLMLKKMRREDPNFRGSYSAVYEARRRIKAGETATGESEKPLIDTGAMSRSITHKVT